MWYLVDNIWLHGGQINLEPITLTIWAFSGQIWHNYVGYALLESLSLKLCQLLPSGI